MVLDFETTGMSPEQGERAIEVGAVLIRENEIVDRFQSLMNPERRINSFIEGFTGITNDMLREAPKTSDVMAEFCNFIGKYPLVAHNASFDRRFLDAELNRIQMRRQQDFGCTLLVARRIYPEAPNHKLETLVKYKQLPTEGQFHRALADAEMTAHLWLRMGHDLQAAYGFQRISFELMNRLATVAKAKVPTFLKKEAQEESFF